MIEPLTRRSQRNLDAPMLALMIGVLVTVLLAPLLAGVRVHVTDVEGMAPTLQHHHAVVTTPVPPKEVLPGDLVTYRDPEAAERLLTRRAVEVRTIGAITTVVTRADTDGSGHAWNVSADGSVGVVRARVPGLGRALSSLDAVHAWGALLALSAIGSTILAVVPRRSRGDRGRASSSASTPDGAEAGS